MPHLQFEINRKVSNETKEQFANQIRKTFCEVMDMSHNQVAISLREHDKYSLSIGDSRPTDNICLMNLDINEGQDNQKKKALANAYMKIVKANFGVNKKNQYVSFTEHKNEDFYLVEKYLYSWEKQEKVPS